MLGFDELEYENIEYVLSFACQYSSSSNWNSGAVVLICPKNSPAKVPSVTLAKLNRPRSKRCWTQQRGPRRNGDTYSLWRRGAKEESRHNSPHIFRVTFPWSCAHPFAFPSLLRSCFPLQFPCLVKLFFSSQFPSPPLQFDLFSLSVCPSRK